MHVCRAARVVSRMSFTQHSHVTWLQANSLQCAMPLDHARRRLLSSEAIIEADEAGDETKRKSATRAPRRKRERPPPITLTPRAARHLAELLASKPDKVGVRLGVKRRGCNGMSYTMKYADKKPEGDEEVAVQVAQPDLNQGVSGVTETVVVDVGRQSAVAGSNNPNTVRRATLFVDPMATLYIAGTVMDWEETELSSEFTFRNPNAKGECGCGESFNV